MLLRVYEIGLSKPGLSPRNCPILSGVLRQGIPLRRCEGFHGQGVEFVGRQDTLQRLIDELVPLDPIFAHKGLRDNHRLPMVTASCQVLQVHPGVRQMGLNQLGNSLGREHPSSPTLILLCQLAPKGEPRLASPRERWRNVIYRVDLY